MLADQPGWSIALRLVTIRNLVPASLNHALMQVEQTTERDGMWERVNRATPSIAPAACGETVVQAAQRGIELMQVLMARWALLTFIANAACMMSRCEVDWSLFILMHAYQSKVNMQLLLASSSGLLSCPHD